MKPTLPGWKVECVGDDIAWMKFDSQGEKCLGTSELLIHVACVLKNHLLPLRTDVISQVNSEPSTQKTVSLAWPLVRQ